LRLIGVGGQLCAFLTRRPVQACYILEIRGGSCHQEANMSLCMRILMLICSICVLSVPVRAFDNGQYADVPDNVRSWFKSVHSPRGVPCCDIADGHRTTWKGDETGRYWVPIDNEWVQVPEGAVVYDAGNPVGEAVVWYTKYFNEGIVIRCFVPGDGV
jgi:hypothetical protein